MGDKYLRGTNIPRVCITQVQTRVDIAGMGGGGGGVVVTDFEKVWHLITVWWLAGRITGEHESHFENLLQVQVWGSMNQQQGLVAVTLISVDQSELSGAVVDQTGIRIVSD